MFTQHQQLTCNVVMIELGSYCWLLPPELAVEGREQRDDAVVGRDEAVPGLALGVLGRPSGP